MFSNERALSIREERGAGWKQNMLENKTWDQIDEKKNENLKRNDGEASDAGHAPEPMSRHEMGVCGKPLKDLSSPACLPQQSGFRDLHLSLPAMGPKTLWPVRQSKGQR